MTSGEDVAANLETAGHLLERAAANGARLAVLPENFAHFPRRDVQRRDVAEREGAGPIQAFLAARARTLGIWIVGGTLPLVASSGTRVRAACLVYDADGECVARYDKIHLFDVTLPDSDETYRESSCIEPGSTPVVLDTPAGRLGLAVCYDLRFPELFRALVARGAEWIALPAAFTAATGRAHWDVLLRARAVENLCYLVAAAQTGRHSNGRETYGDSLIVEPWGRVMARLPQGEGTVLADIDRERVQRLRQQFPVLDHRQLL